MIIGVDIDGIVADFVTGFNKVLFKATGREVENMVANSWDWPIAYGFTEDEVEKAMEAAYASPNFWSTLPPYNDTEAALFWLRKRWVVGDDIYFITSRKGNRVKDQTVEWLNQFNAYLGGGVPDPTVLITHEKGLACKALNVDHYIDDKDENIIDVAVWSPRTYTYLLRRPWNCKNSNLKDLDRFKVVDKVVGFIDE